MVDSVIAANELRELFRGLRDAIRPGAVPERLLGQVYRVPRQRSITMDQAAAAGTASASVTGLADISVQGHRLTLALTSHMAAVVEVCFDGEAGSGNSAHSTTAADGWFGMRPGDSVTLPPSAPFRSFKVRRHPDTPASATIRAVFTIDGGSESKLTGVFPQLSAFASLNTLMRAVQLDGDEGDVEGADGSTATRVVPAIAAWTGAAYVRLGGSAAGRLLVNLIAGQDGIAAGAGAVGATVPRTTLASDDPAVVALQVIDDWDESDRAKTNPIVGQAGIAANVGDAGATVTRTVPVTTPTSTSTQASVTNVDSTPVAANTNRKALVIKNGSTTAGDGVYLRANTAADNTAFLLGPSESITITDRRAIHAIRQTNNVTLYLYEESYA